MLPKNWTEIKISDLTKVVAGGTPRTSQSEYFDGDVPWITPVDLSGYKKKYISKGRRNLSELGLKKSSARLLPKDTVLFSSRAPIGYVAIAENELTTNQGFKNLIPNERFDPSYAYYYLKHIKDIAESQASGTTFKELSGNKMGQLPFLLAPLKEQRKISAKLDLIFNSLDSLNTRLEYLPQLINAFKETVLSHAINGKLTDGWRRKNKIRFDWKEVSFEDVSEINPGHKALRIDQDVAVSFVPMRNIQEETGVIDLSEIKLYKTVSNGYTKFIENDVLFAKITPCMENGKIAIAKGLKNGIGCGTTELHVFRCKENIQKEFLFYYLIRKDFREQCKNNFQGTSGHLRVPVSFLKEHKFLLPPLAEQNEIIRRIEELLKIIISTNDFYQQAVEKIKGMAPSVLSKAFKGELIKAL